MPEAFKNHFNHQVIQHLGGQIKRHYAQFDELAFNKLACMKLTELELKARSNQICEALIQTMPNDFAYACKVIQQTLAPPSRTETNQYANTNKGPDHESMHGIAGWIMMPVSDFVTQAALSGLSNPEHPNFLLGLNTLKECTKRFTAEFAIRPFLRDYPSQTLTIMHKWAKDDNLHVRRLVSEGTRPLLPWGLRLHNFADNPDLIIPLLEQLRDDSSEYVRRSVANSLNDIAKSHPNKVAEVCKKWWVNSNEKRTKLIKHACRTLLKNGHAGALALFGYPEANLIKVALQLSSPKIEMGEALLLTISFSNSLECSQNLLIDYIVHHQKANGSMRPKVFKWTSVLLNAGEQKVMSKKHSFKAVTTRKYYAGEHKIELLINGKVLASQSFSLV